MRLYLLTRVSLFYAVLEKPIVREIIEKKCQLDSFFSQPNSYELNRPLTINCQ